MAVVGIATPHAGKVLPDFYRELYTMQSEVPQHTFVYIEVDTMVIGKARNMCVDVALANSDIDVVWFVDDDVLVPKNAGILIDQALSLGVVSGVYYSRRPPSTPQVYRTAPSDPRMYFPMLDLPEGGLFKADAVGAGCLAVSAQIFRKLHESWDPSQYSTGLPQWLQQIVSGLSPWFEFLDKKGEDMYFCERLRQVGIPIWVNADVQCVHVGTSPIGQAHFKYLMENNLVNLEGELNEVAIPPCDSR